MIWKKVCLLTKKIGKSKFYIIRSLESNFVPDRETDQMSITEYM